MDPNIPAPNSKPTIPSLPGLSGLTTASSDRRLESSTDPSSTPHGKTSATISLNPATGIQTIQPPPQQHQHHRSNNSDNPTSPRPEDLQPMGNIMKARLYSYGGSNSVQVAQRASGLGARPSIKNATHRASDTANEQPWGAYPTDLTQGSASSSFIARRPSPSKKSMLSVNLYTKRSSGRRLRKTTVQTTTPQEIDTSPSVTFASSPIPSPLPSPSLHTKTSDFTRSGLDVPHGMSDSNPNVALENYHQHGSEKQDYETKEDEDGDGDNHNNNTSTATATDHQHTRKSITRGDLLRQAQHFKTFMEIMEEHPLYEMPYGDSFLYLKSISGSTYDLDIVPHDEIDPYNYFTLSYSGVTHFVEDQGSEFTQLDQFEREHYLFSQICKLRFFQQFWMSKTFTTWRKNLRATKMKAAEERLKESLFILHPVLRQPLLELHDLSVKAENFNLYDVDATRANPYTLDEFCDAQVLKSDNTKVLLDNIFNTQIKVAFDACEKTLNTFLIDNHFHTTSDVGSYNGSNSSSSSSNNSRRNPMQPLQQRRASGDVDGVGLEEQNVITVSFTERAAMRTQCKKLVKFIRLVDFFTVHAYLKSARGSISYLMNRIRKVDPESGQRAADNNSHFDSDDESIYEGELEEHHTEETTVSSTATSPVSQQQPLFVVEMDYEVRTNGLPPLLKFMPVMDDFKRRVERAVVGNLQVLSSRVSFFSLRKYSKHSSLKFLKKY